MNDQTIWSIRIGRWKGISVRLHMFFLLFAAFTFYLSWLDATFGQADGLIWNGPLLLIVLLISVLVHEVCHVAVVNRLGGQTDEVVVGPLGGLGPAPWLPNASRELVAVAAGPLINLGICLIVAIWLALRGNLDLVGLMYPLSPQALEVGDGLSVVLKMAFWVNWLLVLVNLIPAFPFDGGQALKAALFCRSPGMDRQFASLTVARVAKLTALGLLIAAWFVRNENPNNVVQTWFALVLLAIFVYFSARKTENTAESIASDEGSPDYDFSPDFSNVESTSPHCSTNTATSPLIAWWQRRQQQRQSRKLQQNFIEDDQVDLILSRLHESGYDSLTVVEQSILERASARYRKRLE
ncbi:MAG: hypothetical protein GY768_04740 [Planctomycetaceae bacterium]|nr:hypothetical protein [Planctomycetaceae bacterium]